MNAHNVEGHLSEIALSMLADGQDALLEPSSHEHLETCEICQGQLADALLEHALVFEAMHSARDQIVVVATTPWGWIAGAAALVLAVRGAPLLEALGRANYVRDVQQLARGLVLLGRSLLAQSSLALGLAAVGGAIALVMVLAMWVAPRSEQA